MKKIIYLLILSLSHYTYSQAPGKSRIKKDLWGSRTISVEFTGDDKGRHLKYYKNGFEVKEYTVGGIKIKVKTLISGYNKPVTAIVYGDAVYDVVGSTYRYKQFRVAANEYLGIPGAPTSKDILNMIHKNMKSVFSSENQNIIIDKPKISIANNPNFKWGGIGKFTCNFTAKFWYKGYLPYDEKGTYIAYVEMPFQLRIFRDGIGAPWRDLQASGRRSKIDIFKKKYMSQSEMNQQQTLWEIFKDGKKTKKKTKPTIKIPVKSFDKSVDLTNYIHQNIFTLPKQSLYNFFEQIMSSGQFKNSNGTLTGFGKQWLKKLIEEKIPQIKKECTPLPKYKDMKYNRFQMSSISNLKKIRISTRKENGKFILFSFEYN